MSEIDDLRIALCQCAIYPSLASHTAEMAAKWFPEGFARQMEEAAADFAAKGYPMLSRDRAAIAAFVRDAQRQSDLEKRKANAEEPKEAE